MCYPAIVVIGQLLAALKSGKYDPDHTSIDNIVPDLRRLPRHELHERAASGAELRRLPAGAGLRGARDCRRDGRLRFSRRCSSTRSRRLIYGDLLQNVKNRMMPYELHKGETQQLLDKWIGILKQQIHEHPGYFKFASTIRQIVKEFDSIPIDEKLWKPKVGIVGEILAKYHPVANNHIERELLARRARRLSCRISSTSSSTRPTTTS
jgi:hypothetical protein